MSEHTHHDHSINEQKPVSFTVPFILATVVITIIVMFLSLCDPKAHHGTMHEKEAGHAKTGASVHESNGSEATVPASNEAH